MRDVACRRAARIGTTSSPPPSSLMVSRPGNASFQAFFVRAAQRDALRENGATPVRARCYDRVLPSGVAMNTLGIVSESSTRASARKPPFIPSFGFHEVHESQPIGAPPARIIDVVASLDMRADPVIDTLLTVREFPAAIAGALRNVPAGPGRALRLRRLHAASSRRHVAVARLDRALLAPGARRAHHRRCRRLHPARRPARREAGTPVRGGRARLGRAHPAHRNLRPLPERTHALPVRAVLARDPAGKRLDPASYAGGGRARAGLIRRVRTA